MNKTASLLPGTLYPALYRLEHQGQIAAAIDSALRTTPEEV